MIERKITDEEFRNESCKLIAEIFEKTGDGEVTKLLLLIFPLLAKRLFKKNNNSEENSKNDDDMVS